MSIEGLRAIADAVLAGDLEESDRAMAAVIRAEFDIVARALSPKFADAIDLQDHPAELAMTR